MSGMTAIRAGLLLAVLEIPVATQASDKGAFLSFESYQRARLLCQEFVHSKTMEIHWRSFAIPDPPAKVVAFYSQQHGTPTRDENGGLTWHLQGDPGSLLTVYPAARSGDFPHCSEKPQRGEQTVVLTSVARKR